MSAGAGVAAPTAAAAPANAAVTSDGLGDSDAVEVFVESTWRGKSVKYDREQQSEPLTTKEAAQQAPQRKAFGVCTPAEWLLARWLSCTSKHSSSLHVSCLC